MMNQEIAQKVLETYKTIKAEQRKGHENDMLFMAPIDGAFCSGRPVAIEVDGTTYYLHEYVADEGGMCCHDSYGVSETPDGEAVKVQG